MALHSICIVEVFGERAFSPAALDGDAVLVKMERLPVPHLVIDEALESWKYRSLWDSVRVTSDFASSGKMLNSQGQEVSAGRKKNHNIWLQDETGATIPIGKTITKHLLHLLDSESLRRAILESKCPLLSGLLHVHTWMFLLSYYWETGDKYGPHRDVSWVTANLMLSPPSGAGFDGGDFLLGNFTQENGIEIEALTKASPEEVRRIAWKGNRLILFPGHAMHGVDEVFPRVDGVEGARVTVQGFPAKV